MPPLPRRPLPPALRHAVFAMGWVLLGIGIAGVLLPVLPGTVFLILSAACFARSSPRFETWLLNHRSLGPPVIAWRETGAIGRKAKLMAVSGMAASILLTWWSGAPGYVIAIVVAIMLPSAAYVLTRPAPPPITPR